MANLRVIKKDIVFLVNEVISDCWVYLQLNPECDQAPVEQIIADAVALGDQTFDKVNHAPKEGKKASKKLANFFIGITVILFLEVLFLNLI